MKISTDDLRAVFGSDAHGQSLIEWARASKQRFVRSQVQLAFDRPEAKGYRMSAEEALGAFGFETLIEIVHKGAAPLVKKRDEPAATFSARRKSLGLTDAQVARSAGVSVVDVRKAETPGVASPIRILLRLAQSLGLDERQVSFVSGAGGDQRLGVRLRQMLAQRDTRNFSASEVIALSEAAWVVRKQHEFSKLIESDKFIPLSRFKANADYSYPTFRKGYDLAKETRRIIGLADDEPISSIRLLLEEKLGIPLIQLELRETFAGATLANGPNRGIVVNERGLNQNVWVRRMTLAHEIGHLLWDPDERLNSLTVDRYDDLFGSGSNSNDLVEMRANAFAIAFLAPEYGVRSIVERENSLELAVNKVMTVYGVSATAAKYHIKNLTKENTDDVMVRDLSQPSSEWIAAENLTIDFFRPSSTPISRRGRFAWYVAQAWHDDRITSDTAAVCLRCSVDELEASREFLFSILGIDGVKGK